MTAVVVPYRNPDLDGVASAMAVEILSGHEYKARIIGVLDDETVEVLGALRLAAPERIEGWKEVKEIWLVDTHHPSQLPSELPADRVVRITDHHPGGSPSSYPRAEIQNEAVGAAATLIAERLLGGSTSLPAAIALLLQAAIVSNTLDFRAPATSSRDIDVCDQLRKIAPLPDALKSRMEEARRTVLKLETDALLRRDTKIFGAAPHLVVVAQIEAPGAIELVRRSDLREGLAGLLLKFNAASAVAVFVDTEQVESAVIATDRSLMQRLGKRLDALPSAEGLIRVSRILQRKTDIVPELLGQI